MNFDLSFMDRRSNGAHPSTPDGHRREMFFRLAVSIALWSTLTGSVNAAEMSLSDVLEAWTEACDAIESYDLYLSLEMKVLLDPKSNWAPRAEPLRLSKATRQVYRRGERRIEAGLSPSNEKPVVVAVWDGELSKVFDASAQYLTVDSHFEHTTAGAPGQIDYEAIYRVASRQLAFVDIFRERTGANVSGSEGDLIQVYAPPTKEMVNYSPFGLRVWLDTRRGLMPVRLERLLDVSGGVVVEAERTNDLSEVAPGVWAPIRSAITVFAPIAGANPRAKASETIVSLDESRSRFNIEVPDDVFDITVPAGASVDDAVAGVRYTFGQAADPAQHLSELVLRGKESAAKLRDLKGVGEITTEGGGAQLRNLLFLNAVAIGLIAAAETIRRRFRGRRANA